MNKYASEWDREPGEAQTSLPEPHPVLTVSIYSYPAFIFCPAVLLFRRLAAGISSAVRPAASPYSSKSLASTGTISLITVRDVLMHRSKFSLSPHLCPV